MKPGLRPSMAGLHTWLGLLFGWVLYFIFVTGTVGYLDTEIDRWMRPELPVAHYPVSQEPAIQKAREYLQAQGGQARRWTISLPINRNEPYLQVSWQAALSAPASASGTAYLDLESGQALPVRDTSGGQTLYQMHWRLHYLPTLASEWIVGLATMAMLIGLITGVVVHKRIFADFFTLRLGKGQRSWLDAHNVASVVSLPFQLMITYSGLVFLMFSFMPLIVAAWYGPGAQSHEVFLDEVFPPLAPVTATGRAAPLLPLDRVLLDAQAHWATAPIAMLDIQNPDDANARISVIGDFAAGPLRATNILVYDGVSGERLTERPAWQSTAKASRDLLLGLHEGLFAPAVLRALYVLSGLLGAAMIATGMVLWTVKRRQRAESGRQAHHAALRLVERLNAAVVVGLPVSIGAYFWANRLLPLDMAQRAAMEVDVLFLAWLLLLLHAALRPMRRVWYEQASLAAIVFCLLPVLNGVTTTRHLGQSLPTGDWVMAGFDLASLVVGAAFLGLARAVIQRGDRKGSSETLPKKASVRRC